MRILIANENSHMLGPVARIVEQLGHEGVALEDDVDLIASATYRDRPDVALVRLGPSSQHALELISAIVRDAYCPVIAYLPADDPEFVTMQRGAEFLRTSSTAPQQSSRTLSTSRCSALPNATICKEHLGGEH